MSYTALYRKWRPDRFDDVKGQDAIVTTLKNQVRNDRIGHAYLFCGTRGTGKTTVAKIFARTVNCENPVDGNPCGECPTCRAIASGASMNVMEIDAASNNGVDDIRRIREEVQYSPTTGRYKVYIIDEVHMLSLGAFNALLKTLEEPPSYVIFILATTETHKIPVTIMSRCQRYDFKRITVDTITARLSELSAAEGVSVEDKALRYIAKAADGAMRDALSLLDQCMAFYLGKELKYDNVLEVLGAVDTEVFSRLLRMVVGNDTLGCIGLLDEMVMQGRDLGQFVTDFTWYLRNLLILKTSPDGEDAIDMSTDNLTLLREECGMVDVDSIMRFIRIFSELSNEVKYSGQKRVLVEVALIKLTRPAIEQTRDIGELAGRVAVLEKRLDEGLVNVQAAALQQSAAQGGTVQSSGAQEAAVAMESMPDATGEDLDRIVNGWGTLVQRVSSEASWAYSILRGSYVQVSDDGSGLVLHVADTIKRNFLLDGKSGLSDLEGLIVNGFGVRANIARVIADEQEEDDRSRMAVVESSINVDIINDDSEEDI
jgi:DNA polymerase-3 subunit gamma/tau